tara:strand:- start:653 stop:1357 length:705 start_codon:yes stop_codon:yes gene_type:complete
MKRRDSIKTITLGAIGASYLLNGCYGVTQEKIKRSLTRYQYGRTPQEKLYDDKLFNQEFFNDEELTTLNELCNLILPPNDYGSIEEAEVVQLIEFMAKDIPSYQKPLRDGINWINKESDLNFNQKFTDIPEDSQKQILDKIAYYDPNQDMSDLPDEVQWFNLLRNLTVTGYFTSQVGIKELGYKGNSPNVWDGVPQEVLDDHGLSYDEEWLSKFVDQSKRLDIAKWDDDGNLIS